MPITYFKRFRMQYDLDGPPIEVAPLAEQYQLVPWDGLLVEVHAEAKFRAFRGEMDAHVFPCLADAEGCAALMREISRRSGFLAPATWLAIHWDDARLHQEPCGTVQGLRDGENTGSIQNLGVVAAHRGFGLGTALLAAALDGFRRVGLRWASLEVTAHNTGALRLYRRLGFQVQRVVYKSIEVPAVSP